MEKLPAVKLNNINGNDSNGIQTHNHLVRKRTLNHLMAVAVSSLLVESRWCHLNFRYRVCFQQGIPWHSGNYRVWIDFETPTWHDNNIQS